MKYPFIIYPEQRMYKGKKVTFFRYSISESSGLSAEVCAKHQRKTIKAKTKSDARQKVYTLIQDLLNEYQTTGSASTFGEYTKNWMAPGKCHYERMVMSEGRSLGPGYMKEYRSIYEKHIATDELICGKIMREITRGDLIRLRERLAEKLGIKSTARKAFKIVKQNMKYATTMGHIPFDPALGMADIKDPTKERGIFTIDEIPKIFPPGEAGPWKDAQDRLAFLLAYSCGLRKGEVLGLRWKNVRVELRAIKVDEALIDVAHTLGDPKKGKRRWCPIPGSTLQQLLAWRYKSQFPDKEHYVFCYQKKHRENPAGKHFSGGWWRSRFAHAMKKAGIDTENRGIVPHSLRHSLNTHLQDKGYSREKLRDTLGWSNEDVQAIYTHSDMMDHSGQADIVDSIIEG